MKNIGFALLLMCVILPANATIYKWADSAGNIHFSDTPHEGAEAVDLPPPQTYSPPQAGDKPAPNEILPPPDDVQTYNTVQIIQPQDQETIRNNQGYIPVMIRIEPELKPGDQIQLVLDGKPIGKPQHELVFSLNSIDRGSHTVAAQVLNDKGEVLITSEAITVFLFRPSVGMGSGRAR